MYCSRNIRSNQRKGSSAVHTPTVARLGAGYLHRSCRRKTGIYAAVHEPSDAEHSSSVREKRRWARRQRFLKKEPALMDQDFIQLNVAGKEMWTTRATLLQVPGSKLFEMFRKENDAKLKRDVLGRVLLDYDPNCFAYVLKYLREVKLAGGQPVKLPALPKNEEFYFRQLLLHLKLIPPNSCSSPNLPSTTELKRTRNNAAYQTALCATSTLGELSSGLNSAPQQSSSEHRHDASSQVSGSNTLTEQTSTFEPAPLGTPPPAPKTVLKSPPRLPTISQLFYIQTSHEPKRGIKVSVYTEADLKTLSPCEKFDVFCDTTYCDSQLSMTFVASKDFDNAFLGITSRNQLDRKGAHIPCYGWKRFGCTYVEKRGEEGSLLDIVEGQQTLWNKGDSVELIVSMEPCRLTLKVNGTEVDRITKVPPLGRSSWCWYLALYTGGDMSCVVFQKDNYAVFWGDYVVKRFL